MGNVSDKPILITQAVGYIASYTISILLEKNYKVRGTVRPNQKKQKIQSLKELKGSQNLQIVVADLTNQQCWDKIIQGCEYVLYIDSPIPFSIPKDQNQIFSLGVNAIKYVLNASLRQKVKRLVFTSSYYTMFKQNQNNINNAQEENNMWGDQSKSPNHIKSKIKAERQLWTIFNSQNLKQDHTEVVSILIPQVVGKTLFDQQTTFRNLLQQIMNKKFPGIPDPQITFTLVDVRDVALANLKALQKSSIGGERIAIASSNLTLTKMMNLLNEVIKNKYDSNKTLEYKRVNSTQIKFHGNLIAKKWLSQLGKQYPIINKKSKRLLNLQYKDVEQSIKQMANQLIEQKIVNLFIEKI